MTYLIKALKKSEVQLTVTVQPQAYEPYLQQAAQRLSARANIKGFRKGKAPYDIVKKEVGEMAILQEALESIVKDTFYEAIQKESIETIGMPKIDITKAAPGNDVEYSATVALIPKVTLPALSKIKAKKKDVVLDEKKLTETLDALRGMHAKESIKESAAQATDKLVIDMNMLLDGVPVEGGQAKGYQVYLSEDHYIPGFNKELVGLKKGEKKEFMLTFPVEHYQKHLAGKKVHIAVDVKEVYERHLPELNEEFAKKLGQKGVDELKKLIGNNIFEETKMKAEQSFEIDILNNLIEKASFEDIPDIIIDSEKQKMFFELKRDLERQGVSIDQYLADLKKKEEDLFNDFKEQATRRAKAALVSRQIAKENNIIADAAEIDAEIEILKNHYKDDPEAQTNISRPEVRDTIATTIQNRKVMAWLKEQITKTDSRLTGDHPKGDK